MFDNFESKHLLYILVAVVLFMLVFFIGIPFFFSELKDLKRTESEKTNKVRSRRYIIPITKGICSLSRKREVISTNSKRNSSLYVDLIPSINFSGGAQYSYSFWLRKATGTNDSLKNKIIFYRGNELKCRKTEENPPECTGGKSQKGHIYNKDGITPDPYKEFQPEHTGDSPESDIDKKRGENRFVKAPLVRFGDFDVNGKNTHLVIEFNSLRNPHLKVELDGEVFSLLKSSSKHPKYNLITVSFQDNFDFGGVERGIKVEVFIDDALAKTEVFEDNALRLNNGPIVLFPGNVGEQNTVDAEIVDLTYYNFATSTMDVDRIYNNGFRERVCQLPDSWDSTDSKYDYGKINLYNETRQLGPSS